MLLNNNFFFINRPLLKILKIKKSFNSLSFTIRDFSRNNLIIHLVV